MKSVPFDFSFPSCACVPFSFLQTPNQYREIILLAREAQHSGGRAVRAPALHHAAQDDEGDASPCMDPPSCDPNHPFRSIDGSCNNLGNPNWGRAGMPFMRLVER